MTNYQEQLTQMQHELETGLENMAEALANTGGDTAGNDFILYNRLIIVMYQVLINKCRVI